MRVVLDKNDIEKLIRTAYQGITKVEFPDTKMEILIEINPEQFFNKPKYAFTPQVVPSAPIVPVEKTEAEKLDEARQKGLMAAGERVMTRVF